MTNLPLPRRQFLSQGAAGLGTAALASLLGSDTNAKEIGLPRAQLPTAKAKRAIYLFMSGAPSQLDMYDYKPEMEKWFDKDLPDSVRQGQRLTTMTSKQSRFPIAPSMYKFAQHGKSGAWVSELLPHTAKVVDDMAFVKTVWTEAINHDPAITYIQTGRQIPGLPSLGSWLSYGLGSAQNRRSAQLSSCSWSHRGHRPKRIAQALCTTGSGEAVFFPPSIPGCQIDECAAIPCCI